MIDDIDLLFIIRINGGNILDDNMEYFEDAMVKLMKKFNLQGKIYNEKTLNQMTISLDKLTEIVND